jgi:hypothetical protein
LKQILTNISSSQIKQSQNKMFHPLLPNYDDLKDQDIEQKLSEAMKKYNLAAKLGNQAACFQIQIIIDDLQTEMSVRKAKQAEKIKTTLPFDKLINIK